MLQSPKYAHRELQVAQIAFAYFAQPIYSAIYSIQIYVQIWTVWRGKALICDLKFCPELTRTVQVQVTSYFSKKKVIHYNTLQDICFS